MQLALFRVNTIHFCLGCVEPFELSLLLNSMNHDKVQKGMVTVYALHPARGILSDEVVKMKMYVPLLLLGIFLLLDFVFCAD